MRKRFLLLVVALGTVLAACSSDGTVDGEGWGLWDMLLTFLWLFLLFAWIWVLISIFADVFRNDTSGWVKAGWVVFLIFLPVIGALAYLIFNGGDMQKRRVAEAIDYERAHRDYIRSVAGTGGSAASELQTLAGLRDSGVITEEEFQAEKAKLIG